MDYIMLPSSLVGFSNDYTKIVTTTAGGDALLVHGKLEVTEADRTCSRCGSKMHVHGTADASLRHVSVGHDPMIIQFEKVRHFCPHCSQTRMQEVPFQAKGHRITEQLYNFVRDLLSWGLTLKMVSKIAGLGKNTVKQIDLERLRDLYTIDGERLIKPERQARVLGIDEFLLHKGHKYATVIIDMETGHILWLAFGRKKACVYAFIEHVGLEWMAGVEAVACDMNSDFQQAFQDSCPHIKVVFDYFHIHKNLNDKVVSEVRKDEQRRLLDEGDKEGAKALKGSRYILFSSRKSLEQKDEQARLAKAEPKEKAGGIFEKPKAEPRDDHLERYERLLEENKLFFTLDLIKELLTQAYEATDEKSMKIAIDEIIDLCEATGNKHFLWFKRLLENHMFGIITHATYNISSGKIEGLNNVIKTTRKQGYGYPDDEYFFLKLFDASRRTYERNPSAIKIPQDL